MAANAKSSGLLTDKQIERKVNYWAKRMGITCIRILIETYSDSQDPISGTALPQPQYRQGTIRFNTTSPEFKREPDVVIRHELGHLMLAMYTQAVEHLVTDADTRKILNDLEDEVVTSISWMPALAN